LFAFSLTLACYVSCHITSLIIIIFGKGRKLWSFLLCSFLHPPVTSSLSGQNILLSPLSSNTLNLCSSFNMRDQASHRTKKQQIKSSIHFNLCLFEYQPGKQTALSKCMLATITRIEYAFLNFFVQFCLSLRFNGAVKHKFQGSVSVWMHHLFEYFHIKNYFCSKNTLLPSCIHNFTLKHVS
jgi:hypothetical protein